MDAEKGFEFVIKGGERVGDERDLFREGLLIGSGVRKRFDGLRGGMKEGFRERDEVL